MQVLKTALLGATALLLALPALAQQSAPAPARERGARGPDAMFQRIDTNRDGRVAWEEAWGFVQQRFGEADRDRDGGLTLAEMQAVRMQGGRGDGGRPEGAREGMGGGHRGQFAGMMFRAVDADRDGRVTLAEIRPMVEARFRSFDANGDNAVSRDEVPQSHHGRGPRGADRAAPDGQAPATPR